MKKKKSIALLFALYAVQVTLSNFIHPITPTLFKDLGFPDYMFGVAFAAMSFSNFLFCPIWGVVGDKIGHLKMFGITAFGYGLGQLFFGLATTPAMTLLARFFGGAFAGGFMVAIMAYLTNNSEPEKLASRMSYLAALTSVFTAIGYLLGGVIGERSVFWDFALQVGGITLVAILMPLLVAEELPETAPNAPKQSLNPLKAFISMGKGMSAPLGLFLAAVFFANFATIDSDNAFNYYIKAERGFPPSYNGIIKAAIGIIGLLINLTVNVWLARKTDMRRSIVPVFGLCTATLVAVCLVPGTAPFIAANVIFYLFNVMYIPMQQTLVTSDTTTGKTSGELSGIFNAVKAVGMIGGSLFAGLIYTVGAKLPFWFGALSFGLAAVTSIFSFRAYQKKGLLKKEATPSSAGKN